MSVFLCGNTGFDNHGCEAIVSATVRLLPCESGRIFLTSFRPKTDEGPAKRYGVNLIPYASYPTRLHRLVCAGVRLVTPFRHCGSGYTQRPLFRRLRKDDVCLSVGGDIYCYGRPAVAMALNHYAAKKQVKNVLWCCSIEKEVLRGEILRDLKRYDWILARDALSWQYLKERGLTRVLRCCDPAFFLPAERTELPRGFREGRTIGLNLSPGATEEGSVCLRNVKRLLQYLLEQTDYQICLIPHVYTAAPDTVDLAALKKLAETFHSDRICLVDQELRCEQLKYIISKCRFLVASRTHASIAAYSSLVPTLVLGYSVKSKGIAVDLFGSWEDYVLPFAELKEDNELKDAFLRLMEREEEIRGALAERLPGYRQSLLDAMKQALPELYRISPNALCPPELCTGCTACASACPRGAISMRPDREGFLRPVLEESLCVQCGACATACPSVHRFPDARRRPEAFAAQSLEDGLRLTSSSGGVFQLLGEAVLKRGGLVVGAALEADHRVAHRICATPRELEALKTSKYVQSDLSGVLPEIKKLLEQGREVLFSGTPCQIAGLRAYLGESPEKLSCVDLICHGVPSPAVWGDYCRSKEPLSQIRFRDKSLGWKRHSLRFTHPDGREELLDVTRDPYLKCFVAGHSLRPSCYLCPSKQLSRPSDLTLGDLWGVERLLPELADDLGTSLVLVHSEKGRALLEEIRPRTALRAVPFSQAIVSNRSYSASVSDGRLHGPFFRFVRRLGAARALRIFSGSAAPYRLLRGILRKL